MAKRTKQERTQPTESTIPMDVAEDCIMRLPVQSLLRNKVVCKSWYQSIKSPEFASRHLTHKFAGAGDFTGRLISLVVRSESINEGGPAAKFSLLSGELGDENATTVTDMPTPSISGIGSSSIVGSCNGVLCLRNKSDIQDSPILVMNPAIREYRLLPEPRLQINDTSLIPYLGFGYDAITKDFKVVRLISRRDLVEVNTPVHVELWKLSTGTWTEINNTAIDNFLQTYLIQTSWPPIFVRGTLYWIAFSAEATPSIISFDIGKETFREIMIKDVFEVEYGLRLMEFMGSLAICVRLPCQEMGVMLDPDDIEWCPKEFEIWVKGADEDSWTKQLTIGPFPRGMLPVGCFTEGEFIIEEEACYKLFVYDYYNYKLVKLPLPDATSPYESCGYVESLFSVVRKNRREEQKEAESEA